MTFYKGGLSQRSQRYQVKSGSQTTYKVQKSKGFWRTYQGSFWLEVKKKKSDCDQQIWNIEKFQKNISLFVLCMFIY